MNATQNISFKIQFYPESSSCIITARDENLGFKNVFAYMKDVINTVTNGAFRLRGSTFMDKECSAVAGLFEGGRRIKLI